MWRLLYNFIFHNRRRWMTVQALLLSARARLLLRFVPINRLYPFLGKFGEESSHAEPPKESMRDIFWISNRVSRVARRTPWQSKCFVQALVAQTLLKKHRLSSTLYLGVGRDEDRKMTAHAWLRCGPYFVTGKSGEGYAEVAKFACYPRSGVPAGMEEGPPAADGTEAVPLTPPPPEDKS